MRIGSKTFGLLITIVICASFGSAQDIKWMGVTSADGELSGSMPADSLIIDEPSTGTRLVYSTTDLRLDLWRRPNLSYRKDYSPPMSGASSNAREFEFGKTRGQIVTTERPDRYAVSIFAKAPNYTYFVEAHGKRRDDPRIRTFLAAVMFDGKSLLPDLGPTAEAPKTAVNMKELKSSPVVKEYLKSPSGKNMTVKFEPIDTKSPIAKSTDAGDDAGAAEPNKPLVTRPLIVLSKPAARYTDQARQNSVSGRINAIVVFRADGTIGAVTVDPRLDDSLARNVAEAASRIKFVPVEVEGKPVEVKRMLVYTFSIY
jgi:hypothetical protein